MDDDPPKECVDAEFLIQESYDQHVVLFREFAQKVDEWYTRYTQTMAPMIMRCLEEVGEDHKGADWQLLNTLTSHAENFNRFMQASLSEYEEAYKTSKAIFRKAK